MKISFILSQVPNLIILKNNLTNKYKVFDKLNFFKIIVFTYSVVKTQRHKILRKFTFINELEYKK